MAVFAPSRNPCGRSQSKRTSTHGLIRPQLFSCRQAPKERSLYDRKIIPIFLLGSFFLIALASPAQVPPQLIGYPDAVLFNGKILTFDGPLMREQVVFHKAIALRDGKVFEVGTDDQILKLKGPKTLTVDLKGKTVLPGFVDNHNHPHEWVHLLPVRFFFPNVKLLLSQAPTIRSKRTGRTFSMAGGRCSRILRRRSSRAWNRSSRKQRRSLGREKTSGFW